MTFAENETIISQGHSVPGFYFILHGAGKRVLSLLFHALTPCLGAVAVNRVVNHEVTEMGRRGPGAIVGSLSLLSGSKAFVTAMAATQTITVFLAKVWQQRHDSQCAHSSLFHLPNGQNGLIG